jgi:hypothetical protein
MLWREQYLEENYILMKTILEQQNLGRLQDMAQYAFGWNHLLMLLANVADHQPQVHATAKPEPTTHAPGPVSAPANSVRSHLSLEYNAL